MNPISIGHAVKLREEHDTVKVVLQMLHLLYTISSKTKSSNNQDLVSELLAIYHILGCNTNIKLYYLKSHSDKFPDNLGKYKVSVFTKI